MFKYFLLGLMMAITSSSVGQEKTSAKDFPFHNTMTPESLWAMGRIGSFHVTPKSNKAVYSVSYYSVEKNNSKSVLYTLDLTTLKATPLTLQEHKSERSAVFLSNGEKIAFLSSASGSSQLWQMNVDGSKREQISFETSDVIDFLFSPDEKKVILVKEVSFHQIIEEKEKDLPLASGMVINDLMYKHWDSYITAIPHPFVASFDGKRVQNSVDILEGEPYESPMLPFGGVEQFAFSPDSKKIAYTCRKKYGKEYAISTDSDIFLYDIKAGKTIKNLCKSPNYVATKSDATHSLQEQSVNKSAVDQNVGYDQNPQFSPDGKYIAWLSMERDGYESDRSRLCVYELSTGKKTYVTETFESGVNEFCWNKSSATLFFTGTWHGKTNLYRTNLKGKVQQLTNDVADYVLLGMSQDGEQLFCKKHSMSQADEIYAFNLSQLTRQKESIRQLTFENQAFYQNQTFGAVKERWVKTKDGKEMQCWVIYPPYFDSEKKYPALLFCEGGPQTPVSQFWSYRWNFQMMAANDYIIIAPNRRGLPGYGMEWLESISGDYSGLCMQDYLSAIDDLATETYVDKNRLGAVGASFGGYSVYWLAGHHNKRFKAFIAHDGIFNTQQQYLETEEMWFANWDLKAAPWHKNAKGKMQKVFEESPHLYVDRWDTPILCIHGQKDFRIEYTQAQSAFHTAKLRGVPAQLLLYPDENHWVLKPQNGILWQRTFFRWLDKYLK